MPSCQRGGGFFITLAHATLAAARLGLIKFGEPLVRDFESLALQALILLQLGIMSASMLADLYALGVWKFSGGCTLLFIITRQILVPFVFRPLSYLMLGVARGMLHSPPSPHKVHHKGLFGVRMLICYHDVVAMLGPLGVCLCAQVKSGEGGVWPQCRTRAPWRILTSTTLRHKAIRPSK